MDSGRRRIPGVFPPLLYDAYRSTVTRAPRRTLVAPPKELRAVPGPGPLLAHVLPEDSDLVHNRSSGAEAIGERIIVTGRLLDADGSPVARSLVEVWQTNSAGRYIHRKDQHHAPIDPNFLGIGRCVTDAEGTYRFETVKPGAYPWGNHDNAWRPAHIHFSVFGRSYDSRLITQMYFPGDPLLDLDPVFNSLPNDSARERLVSSYAHDVTQPGIALGYRFDIVVGGSGATPFEEEGRR